MRVPLSRRPRTGLPAVLCALAVVGCAAAGMSVDVPKATAAAGPCPASPVRVAATWGAADGGLAVRSGRPDVSDRPTAVPREGLALAGTIEVRTVRGGRRTGRPVLCLDGRARVRLSALRAGTSVGAVSVNGPYVAWSVVGDGRRGVLNVAELRDGRLRAIRSTRVRTGTDDDLGNGMLVVVPDGTTAWVASANRRARTARGGTWIRGQRPRPLPTTPPTGIPVGPPADHGDEVSSVTVLDRQNVLLGGAPVLRAFRPATPGTCPHTWVGGWTDLAGWQVADVGGFTTGTTEDEYSQTERSVVCDPTRGIYLDVAAVPTVNVRYENLSTAFGTTVRNGSLLVREQRTDSRGGRSASATITDTTTGARHEVSGYLDAAGVPPQPPIPEPSDGPRPGLAVGAVAVPGATAWIERPAQVGRRPSVAEIWLADAAGTRIVGRATAPSALLDGPHDGPAVTGLAIAGDRLSWVAGTTPGAVDVRRRPGEPYGALPGRTP